MKVTIHCSDSDNPNHNDILVIHNWHISPPNNWSKCGYHFFIKSCGDIQDYSTHPDMARQLTPIFETGAHVKGFNSNNIGICLHGKNKFTEHQFKSLRRLVNRLMYEYGIAYEDIKPHNFYDVNKSCPNFNIDDVLNKTKGIHQTY